MTSASEYRVYLNQEHINLLSVEVILYSTTQVYYQPTKTYVVTDYLYNSSQQSTSTTMTHITLSGLYPASTYTVYIRSVNAAGGGNSSTSVSATLAPTG